MLRSLRYDGGIVGLLGLQSPGLRLASLRAEMVRLGAEPPKDITQKAIRLGVIMLGVLLIITCAVVDYIPSYLVIPALVAVFVGVSWATMEIFCWRAKETIRDYERRQAGIVCYDD